MRIDLVNHKAFCKHCLPLLPSSHTHKSTPFSDMFVLTSAPSCIPWLYIFLHPIPLNSVPLQSTAHIKTWLYSNSPSSFLIWLPILSKLASIPTARLALIWSLFSPHSPHFLFWPLLFPFCSPTTSLGALLFLLAFLPLCSGDSQVYSFYCIPG